ncbi:Cytochrome c1 heme lyase [Diaporthe australafricana]|uniref:Holocytochrome c-type synthase n=1 Tax=Diaporthe australafricana TaxID=127596 RepID=A0ABR3VZ65_9PEZI
MLQQDLLDTLFLNRKALADVGGTETGAATTDHNHTHTHSATEGGNKTTTIALTMNKDVGSVDAAGGEKCPVDHRSREAWMAQAKAAQQAQETQETQAQPQTPQASKPTSSSWQWPRIPFLSSSTSLSTTASADQPPPPTQQAQHQQRQQRPGGGGLGTDRVISTIPRSQSAGATNSACPVNHESETGADAKTGNWVYPSEKMFFDAMKRKGHDTRAKDMRTVVPIHNAVNERAWKEIREWELPYATSTCPQGPMLYSFTGLSTSMSPKARLNTLLGYTAPFDRHDWVVDRCGTKVEYVIDFYAGRPDASRAVGGKPSFYLDVRPKLNTWEGVKMRASRAVGLS